MKKYIVRLTQEQRQDLHHLISTGEEAARQLMHARILLKAIATKIRRKSSGVLPRTMLASNSSGSTRQKKID